MTTPSTPRPLHRARHPRRTPPRRRGPFDAVLIISFGGPQGPHEIRPFLQNVLRGRRVPPERVEQVAHHYELFGGVSPLTDLTERQAAALAARLEARNLPLPIYIGMRNWRPLLGDTLRAMHADGVTRAIGLIAAAHHSYSSCTQYRHNVLEARSTAAREAGAFDATPEIVYAGGWHLHDGFIEATADRIDVARATLSPTVRDRARIIFTAHSIPTSMAHAETYQRRAARIGCRRRRAAEHGRLGAGVSEPERTPAGSVARTGCERLSARRARRRRDRGDHLADRLRLRSHRGALRPRHRSEGDV